MPLCSCGSGQYREEVCDARGIFVAYVCDACRAERLAGYRPEIFTDAAYECDEPIDPELCHGDGAFETEPDYGGAFDGFNVTSDADPGL